ncbi:hypothetical protein RYX36_011583 [Vicia faba]
MDVNDDDVATQITSSSSHGMDNFEVMFSGTVKFEDVFNFQKHRSVKIVCEPLNFVSNEDHLERSHKGAALLSLLNMDTESASSSIQPRPFWKHALIVLAGIILLANTFILIILCYRYRTSMPEFGINSASINSLNIKKSRITAEWNITLFITNHDSYHRIFYDDISLNINYNNEHKQRQSLLSSIPLEPFSQRSGFTNTITVPQNMDVNDDDVATQITSSSSHGMDNFEVMFSGTIKFEDVFNFQKHRSVKIVCEPLNFVSNEDHLERSHKGAALLSLLNMDTESASSSIQPRPFWKHALIVLAGIVLLASTFILIILCYRYRTSMPEFGINSASINSLNIKKSRITAEWNITLFITNHDSYHRIFYDDISLNINYNNEHKQRQSLLSAIPLEPFSQRSGFTNTITVPQNMDVNDDDVATQITSSSSHGMDNFEVMFSGTIKFEDVFNFQKHRSVKIVCEPINFVSNEDHLERSHKGAALLSLLNMDTESASSSIQPRPFWKHALIVLAGIVLLASTFILIILCYRYRTSMPEFGINSASINSLNIKKSRITAEWNITLFITNHDSYHRIFYDDISLNINYNNEHKQRQSLLSVVPLEPFSQRSSFTNTITVPQNMDVNDDDVATQITSSSSHGMDNFEVMFSGTIKFEDVFNFQKHRSVKIVCEPLNFVSNEDHLERSHKGAALLSLLNMDTESASSSIQPRPFWKHALIVLAGIVLLASTFILIILCNRYRTSMPEFGINSASINSLNIKKSRITVEWNITLFITNHDSYHRIFYDDISLNINYNNEHKQRQSLLSAIPLEPFSQRSGFTNTITVPQNMDVNDDDVATQITSSSSHGMDNFKVMFSGTIKFEDVFNFQKHRSVKIVCEPLNFVSNEDHLERSHKGHLEDSSNWILMHGVACH